MMFLSFFSFDAVELDHCYSLDRGGSRSISSDLLIDIEIFWSWNWAFCFFILVETHGAEYKQLEEGGDEASDAWSVDIIGCESDKVVLKEDDQSHGYLH